YNGAIGIRHGTEYFANQSTIVADSCRFYNNAGNVIVLNGASRTNNSASISLNRCEFKNNYEMQTGAIIMFAPAVYLGQTVPEGVVSLDLDSCYFGDNNVSNTVYYFPNMADSSRFLMNNCVIDSNGYSNPSLPYGHGNTAIVMSSRTRTNKNYVLNSRINHSSSYYHPAQSTTVAISAEQPGTDSTFIYNVLFNDCQNMNTNIAHQAFNGRQSAVYLVNSTLFKSEVSTQRGWRMILNEGINTTGTGAVTHFYIQNSIIWPSTKHWWTINVPKQLINNSENYAGPGTTRTFIQNSIINTFADGGSLSNIGVDLGGNILQEPIFKDSAAGNFQLVCSTGINSGNDALYNTSLGGMVDLNQKNRFNGTIDIGAFEHYPDSVVVSISGPTSVCAGQQATFTAVALNEGNDPLYQWLVNGTQSGMGDTFSPALLNNNDVVSVIVTSSQRCIEKGKDTSSLQITVLPPGATPTLNVSPSTLPACTGSEIVFTANTNIQQPVYQWSVNGINSGTNANIFSSTTLLNGDKVSLTVSGNYNDCGGTTPMQLNSDTTTINLITPEVPTVQIVATPAGDELPFNITVTNPLPGWIYTLYRNNINTQLTGTSFQNLQDTGAYEVRASGNGCYTSGIAVSNIVVKNAVQNPDVFTSIVLHPVPVRNTLTVSGITANMNLKYCKIFDAKGRLVYLKNIGGNTDFVINEFSNFPAGTYVVCLDDNKGRTKSYKVVKGN
ncbi:MAG: T9SS type A sorting domain-containing protein, partial [Chitinophagaceae bacterium]